ncbi:GIY-YIG nuclease family protein [Gaoshiqia sediminis]|uniref:GIY-YIG nuclease family protein n=1 Tax=Gaoshiqia sediminis TaxID=2986998 RepID=A0AA41Y8I3_9BACT|nr:GIY-YIG nuclease family protein [Gaoshiqia sediminis]MCW0483954.1 GIY-YIG nuclease family protein [Gaoshiqia sediminis]
MPIMLNTILREAGLDPKDIRLIRHKDNRAKKGRSPYELWRDDRPKFELYQSTQSFGNRKKLTAPFWAVFVVNHEEKTMFTGLYSVKYRGLLEQDLPMPHDDGIEKAGSCDVFDLTLQDKLTDLIGRLFIDWGPGALAWIQYAERNEKTITELRHSFTEPEFPGFMNFIEPLSQLKKLPASWISVLKNSRGIYLLTCPKTKEQYVGSASGKDGFWGRWQDYIQTGDGGNVALKNRDTSDYQVSILEVAGTSANIEEILGMEYRWKKKLQSREMGLNRN